MSGREPILFNTIPIDETSVPRRFSAKEIDVNLINKSLANVNNFSVRRQNEKQSTIIMYEITSEGESDYKEMTLRELLNYVNKEAATIDEAAEMKEKFRESERQNFVNKKVSLANVFDSQTEDYSPFDPSTPNSSFVQNVNGLPPAGVKVSRSTYSPVPESSTDDQPANFSAVSELRLRDLRRLDYQFNPNEEKSVLIRRHAVLFAMDPMRAVVMTNRLILIVPSGADSLISILDKYMKGVTPFLNVRACTKRF
jgi:hypothetical protein